MTDIPTWLNRPDFLDEDNYPSKETHKEILIFRGRKGACANETDNVCGLDLMPFGPNQTSAHLRSLHGSSNIYRYSVYLTIVDPEKVHDLPDARDICVTDKLNQNYTREILSELKLDPTFEGNQFFRNWCNHYHLDSKETQSDGPLIQDEAMLEVARMCISDMSSDESQTATNSLQSTTPLRRSNRLPLERNPKLYLEHSSNEFTDESSSSGNEAGDESDPKLHKSSAELILEGLSTLKRKLILTNEHESKRQKANHLYFVSDEESPEQTSLPEESGEGVLEADSGNECSRVSFQFCRKFIITPTNLGLIKFYTNLSEAQ